MTAPFPPEPGLPRTAHVPVLVKEVLRFLDLQEGLTVVDGTVGAGGHSSRILERIGPSGTLIGLDRDARMLQIAARHVSAPSAHLIQSSYADLRRVLAQQQIPAVDRILLDLGLSSDQLADDARGFSFHSEGALDLRFDTSQGESAAEFLARVSESDLAEIIDRFGEDPHSRRIAHQIVMYRSRQSIRTSLDLARAVVGDRPDRESRFAGSRHPATRVFQALRIAVNHELEQLQSALNGVLWDSLKPQGIVVIISFHSLEDRLVKQAFRESQLWQLLCPKPQVASPAEQRLNPRSRSAKLRAARKIGPQLTD